MYFAIIMCIARLGTSFSQVWALRPSKHRQKTKTFANKVLGWMNIVSFSRSLNSQGDSTSAQVGVRENPGGGVSIAPQEGSFAPTEAQSTYYGE